MSLTMHIILDIWRPLIVEHFSRSPKAKCQKREPVHRSNTIALRNIAWPMHVLGRRAEAPALGHAQPHMKQIQAGVSPKLSVGICAAQSRQETSGQAAVLLPAHSQAIASLPGLVQGQPSGKHAGSNASL